MMIGNKQQGLRRRFLSAVAAPRISTRRVRGLSVSGRDTKDLVEFTTTSNASRRCFSSSTTTTASSPQPQPQQDSSSDIDVSSLPQIIPTNKGVPIHLYLPVEDLEPQALAQVQVLAESPLPVEYVAVMPDAHLGKGVTIGTVFASDDYVCPNAVGVDIGCGMAAIPFPDLYRPDLSQAQKVEIQRLIKERIPTGFQQHPRPLPGTKHVLDEISEECPPTDFVKEQLGLPRVTCQLGTLGGGNHFLEVVYQDPKYHPHEDDREDPNEPIIWCLLHSGSRNIGNRVALHYDALAKQRLEQHHVDTQRLHGIHYMPIDSQEGQDYLRDMEWCQRYAFQNRKAMQDILLEVIHEVTGKEADTVQAVNIHHNYCHWEDCGGTMRWVTRKGATSATKGELGIIPGSMGSGSYITRGKGNLSSWNSSSHGAGRCLSRTKAHATIAQDDFCHAMQGVVCDTHPSVRDEAPQAYKDLDTVMRQQSSLTEIVHHLLPLINVKGYEERLPRKYRQNNAKKPRGHKAK